MSRDDSRDLCLHQLFEASAGRSPQAVAVVDGRLEVTYAELERRANRMAHHLRRLGAGPETPVGICTGRSAGMVAALLGALKAGAAYLSLDPAYPRERLAFLLEDAAASVVVTEEGLLDRFPEAGAPAWICLDRDAEALAAESPERLPPTAGPGSLAYVIYTSGSTGRPKGVAIEHRSATALCHWAQATFPAEELAGMLASTSINFDLSVFEIFVPLALGGTVVLAENALVLPQLPAAGRVTFVNTVPSAMAELVRSGGLPSSVRAVGLAGEPLKRVLVERIYATGMAGAVYNLYGPTEDTTYSTWTRVERGALEEPTIGRPLTGTELHLLAPGDPGDPGDPAMAPVAAGEVGEIHLGGAGLARGYLGRPELTAERFLPDPFSGRTGDRLYRVGDLGRRLPDGDVQFLGRVDHQVKIHGFRIELGEVEAALSRHPAVHEAVVVALAAPGEDADRRLVAYLEIEPAAPPPDAAGLRAFLGERLPAHCAPSLFVLLDALPRTLTGKVDRKALPEPAWRTAQGEGAAPRSPLEELLAGIWADVLGREGVSRDDHFFALGGHSLLATRVVSRLREALGVEIPMRRLFELPTVAGLARAVEAARHPDEIPETAQPLPRVPREGDLPLSFAQQRLWLTDQLDPGRAVYNVPWAVRLAGPLSMALLARVFSEIMRRHEALRTTFASRQGRPVQVISPAARVELPAADLSGLPEAERDAEARALLLREALRPFDLERGPLLRLCLIRLGATEHVLSILLHHIVSDDWSMGVLLREVGLLYTAFAGGLRSPLPELPVQYADFAVWQRRRLQGELLERQLAGWKRALAGAPQVLELPTDRPRPPVQTFRGGARPVALAPALSARVRKLCLEVGATPFMALLAAWAVLLGRHAGQDDLLLGAPIAGRNRQEIEELIGFFVNTLMLRSAWDGATGFRELLARVRSTTLDAYERQDLPFERLVEELVPERDLSRTPLVQALFVLQNAPGEPLEILGVTAAPFPLGSQIAKFDLVLSLRHAGDGFAGEIEHNADLFDASTAERLLARFQILLDAAAGEPDRPVAVLPLLAPEEQRQLLAWSQAGEPAPPVPAFPALFAAAAARAPGAPALVFADDLPRVVAYGELDAESSLWAERLRGLGVGPEVPVGICLRRSPRLIVALLAVLRAGGAYVPLDPAYPSERLAWMLDDARLDLVLAEVETAALLAGLGRPVRPLLLDAPYSGAGAALPAEPPGAEQAAYVIYTSGSTGRPKGSVATHGGLAAFTTALSEVMGLTPEDRVLQFASISFDAAAVAIYTTLSRGAALVLHPDPATLSPVELLDLCASRQITVLELPAALWRLAAQEVEAAGRRFGAEARLFMTGGESLAPEALRQWGRTVDPAARLVSSYGPTEATVVASVFQVDGATAAGEPLPSGAPLGRPLAGTTVHLLDARLQPVPVGAHGEILLGGAGVTRGYLRRPELTAEAFLPDPWGPPGARLYRTGDRALRRPAGELEFLGRIDWQIKLRGFRIEPGEIEAVLAGHPHVQEHVVVARTDGPGGPRLVAYAVARDGAALTADGLWSHLAERLPEHMIPTAFVILDALPLTANGKVDRNALPAPAAAPAGTAADVGAAPLDPIEDLLAGIWAEVLGLDRVGVHDNFFTLGGHSLLAAQVVSRIRTVLGAELPLRKLFEARTVAGLAKVAKAARRERAAAAPLVRRPREGGLPLSFAQQRLWFLEQVHPGRSVFNIPTLYALRGPLETAAFAHALAEVVRRHEPLRTTLAEAGTVALQHVHPPSPPELPVVDLSALPPADRSREADRAAADLVDRPFSFGRGLLTRYLLLRAAADDHRFLAVIHHLLSDGLSQGIFERDLAALYDEAVTGRPARLAALPIQSGDWAAWQRLHLTADRLAEPVAFWRRRLAAPLPVLLLPTDRPRPQIPSERGALAWRTLPPDLVAAVRELARREGSTLYITLLTAFFILLHRATGERDLPLGTPVSFRDRPEVEELMGLFVNTLVIRAEMTPAAGFRAHLAHVRERVLEAFGHQEVPFEKLVEELRPERGPHDSPFFQLMFALHTQPQAVRRAGGLEIRPLDFASITAQFELTLYLIDGGGDLVAQVEYRTELFDAATIERLLGSYQALLAASLATPDLPVTELPFEPWLTSGPAPSPPPEPSRPGAPEAIAARAATLEEKRSQLTDEQREQLRQKLRRK